ncbi:MAG: hypothetical protein OJF52_004575 [Nitrospira sp.]|nr:MAG: hypothetical protein OJF52_004575 [Nitrospira sp.]
MKLCQSNGGIVMRLKSPLPFATLPAMGRYDHVHICKRGDTCL